ncbi:hypothetical protein N7528_003439 [Penicillium herquei]|nr:hypothetical protein N7528_003439 [Penicillium herquei]
MNRTPNPYDSWPMDFHHKTRIVNHDREPCGPPVIVVKDGTPWVPTVSRFYLPIGRDPVANEANAKSWLVNWKAEPYLDEEHSDPFIWLGLVMPDKKIMNKAMIYGFENLTNNQKLAFKWLSPGSNDLFFSIAADGLVDLKDADKYDADFSFPDPMVTRTVGPVRRWGHGHYLLLLS